MIDKIETFGKSTLQHGRHNNRVYLMSLAPEDIPAIATYMDNLAIAEGYTKIFAKVPSSAACCFLNRGYRAEASIPGFFNGEEDALFLSKYLCPERQREQNPRLVEEVVSKAEAKGAVLKRKELEGQLVCRRAMTEDAAEMARLYREVFASYPFPIHDSAYLNQTMESHILYYGIWDGENLLALASAEMDRKKGNAEMTDFATRPACRGKGLAHILLNRIENAAAAHGINTAYTIARSYSMGMNITFARNGYGFGGTLTSNTNISGGLESMNVWYKPLAPK